MTLPQTLKDRNIGFLLGKQEIRDGRPTLVMIHGAGGQALIWKNQIRPLDREINVLALDLPGHGETEEKGYDRISDYARWVGDLIRDLFTGPVFLMGHSMGGAIAQKTALECPDLFQGLILVATGSRLKVAPAFLEGLRADAGQIIDNIMAFAYSMNADKRMILEGAKLMKEAPPKVVHDDFFACDQFDVREDVARINQPCLLVCGEEDRLTPPKLSEKLHRSIKGSDLKIIPGTGHMVMIEKFQELNNAVMQFIKRHL
jgi:pimeloyl-ACP methyl ester carboxylesterase